MSGWLRTGGLRRWLLIRILVTGLTVIVGSVVLLGMQIQESANAQRADDTRRTANQVSADVAELFQRWHDELLVASSDAALADWFTHPERIPRLRGRIDTMMIKLHTIYPSLIDEACFIAATGPELARQVKGVAAPVSDLSPDESESVFFRPTFQLAAGQAFQSAPYVSPDSDRWVVANSTPIEVGGAKVALLHFEANLDAVRTLVQSVLPTGMQARIVDTTTGKVIADTAVTEPILKQPFVAASGWPGAAGPVRAEDGITVLATNQNRWRVEVSATGASPFTSSLLVRTGIGVVVAVLVLALVAARIAGGISRPLRRLAEATKRVMATGDRSLRIDQAGDGEIGELGEAIESMLGALGRQEEELREANQSREEELQRTWQRNQEAEAAAREQAQQVVRETTDAVVSELREVVAQVGEVREAGEAIEHRIAVADEVSQRMVRRAADADQAVDAFGESLRRVSGIAKMIAAVAGQTNLLALNATIEAARAGAAGQSFAVVAGEVKNLANTTAESTEEITSTIGSLERDAGVIASTLQAMTEEISRISQASSQVREVASGQFGIVQRLDERVADTIGRVRSLDRGEQVSPGAPADTFDDPAAGFAAAPAGAAHLEGVPV